MTLIATYRLQLGPEMDFEQAAGLCGYLAGLGVSHLYLSPVTEAAPGSSHGYDVVDPTRLSASLGGAAAFRKLCERAAGEGLKVVVDIVPNHMAADPANRWWWDLLTYGKDSAYAGFFDVDWNRPEQPDSDLVLLPVLGDHIGREVEAGQLTFERKGGALRLCYHEHRFPLRPETEGELFEAAAVATGNDRLAVLARSLRSLPGIAEERATDRGALTALIATELEDPELSGPVDKVLEDVAADPEHLQRILDEQHYRLARWTVADQEIGYRRFFDIDQMVAVRSSESPVFERTHELFTSLVSEGLVKGLRVDHVDGLRRPHAYLTKLRESTGRIPIWVEKILEPGEELRTDWPVQGTTGYDAMEDIGRVLLDPAGEPGLTALWERLGGHPWERIAAEAKRTIGPRLLGADLDRLTRILAEVCGARPRHRDHTRHDLRLVVEELAAAFPIYRTYIDPEEGALSDADLAAVETALAGIRQRRPGLDPELIDLVGAILILDLRGEAESEFVYRLQQVTGPVMAKGIEDTAFYRYHRLASRCEVGADPGLFAMSVEEFHRRQAAAAGLHPYRMVATSTHDTKRSEDARARLAVLAEVTGEWSDAVAGWRRHTDRYLSGDAPDLHDQYGFFQNLVAAWPASPDRMLQYMAKATREARRRTSWRNPDPAYDRAVRSFVEGAMVDHEFLGWVEKFVTWITPAARRTALAQKLLALTVPGVPDLYRGSEVWYHALVDPDNRRPVDFARLRNLAERVRSIEADRLGDLADDADGAAKAWLVQRVLGIRRERPESFAGPYTPVRVEGPGADRVVAFRRGEDVAVVVIAPPYMRAPMPSGVFELPPGRWVDRFGDADPVSGFVAVESALHVVPGTVLTRVD